MAQGRNYADLATARAALADPGLPAGELWAICYAQPGLRSQVVWHPSADDSLIAWLANQGDPAVVAAAQSRLAASDGGPRQASPSGWDVAGPARQGYQGSSAGAHPTPVGEGYLDASYPPSGPQPWQDYRQGGQLSSDPYAAGQYPNQYPSPGAQAFTQGPGPARVTAEGPARPGWSRKKVIGLVGAGVGLVAVVLAVVLVVVPMLANAGATYSYAPDFTSKPGVTVVDLLDGLPGEADSWSTDLFLADGTSMVVAASATNALDDYQYELEQYQEATRALAEWTTDYQTGYTDGSRCLADTSADATWYYDTQAEYCEDYSSDYLSAYSDGAGSGFEDSIWGYPNNPAAPNYGTPPAVGDEPVEPTQGDNLRGIDLTSGKKAWSVDLSQLWPGTPAHAWTATTSDHGKIVLILTDATSTEENEPELLVVLDVRTGAVLASTQTDYDDVAGVPWFIGDTVVVNDSEGHLQALDATNLDNERWHSSATPLGWGSEDTGTSPALPGDLLPTSDGLLKLADGTGAGFGRDLGDEAGIKVIANTTADLYRWESDDDSYTLSGLQPGTDTETWHLDDVEYPWLIRAGRYVVADTDGGIEAYEVHGDQLTRAWRHACSESCYVDFADADRVILMDYAEEEVTVLNTSDGKEVDTIRDAVYDPEVGHAVLYNVESTENGTRISAYDLTKSGYPKLWRTDEIAGYLGTWDGHLVVNDSSNHRLGVIGVGDDNWGDLTPPAGG